MKQLIFLSLAIVGLSGSAIAGSPNNPGQNGEFVNFAKDFAQGPDVFGHPNGWGQEVRNQSQGGPLGKLGEFMKDDPFGLTADGKPNPENDQGRGND